MIVIKNINNNVSLCLDSKKNEVIVFGKGVGFVKPPYTIPLNKIEKTFYNVSQEQIELINLIPNHILDVASQIVDYANVVLDNQFQSNVVFTLADHIHFAINRQEKKIYLKMPILNEIEHIYPIECQIGKKALQMIELGTGTKLYPSEAASIALHLVNYESDTDISGESNYNEIFETCTKIIESNLNISIDMNSFNYHRFITHLYYLIKRTEKKEMIESNNVVLLELLKKEFPHIYNCSLIIKDVLKRSMGESLSDEEILYLMLHINRLSNRENSVL